MVVISFLGIHNCISFNPNLMWCRKLCRLHGIKCLSLFWNLVLKMLKKKCSGSETLKQERKSHYLIFFFHIFFLLFLVLWIYMKLNHIYDYFFFFCWVGNGSIFVLIFSWVSFYVLFLERSDFEGPSLRVESSRTAFSFRWFQSLTSGEVQSRSPAK